MREANGFLTILYRLKRWPIKGNTYFLLKEAQG